MTEHSEHGDGVVKQQHTHAEAEEAPRALEGEEDTLHPKRDPGEADSSDLETKPSTLEHGPVSENEEECRGEEERGLVERPLVFALIQSEIRNLCAIAAPQMRDRSVPKETRSALRKILRQAFVWEDLQNALDLREGRLLIKTLEELVGVQQQRTDTSFMCCPPHVLEAMWPLRFTFVFDRGVPKNTPILYEMGDRKLARFDAMVSSLSQHVQDFIAEGAKREDRFRNLPNPRASLPLVEG